MRQGHSTSVFVGALVPWRASFLAGMAWSGWSGAGGGHGAGQVSIHVIRVGTLDWATAGGGGWDRRHATDWQRPVKPHRQSVIPWYLHFIFSTTRTGKDGFGFLSVCVHCIPRFVGPGVRPGGWGGGGMGSWVRAGARKTADTYTANHCSPAGETNRKRETEK